MAGLLFWFVFNLFSAIFNGYLYFTGLSTMPELSAACFVLSSACALFLFFRLVEEA